MAKTHNIFHIGPLILKGSKTGLYTVIGVASGGPDSLKNITVVAIYARINQVLPWIYDMIGGYPRSD